MTIPSRPAPAPPGSRSQNAAAGANASLEQLRTQLQQQQIIQIRLPPPPKGGADGSSNGIYYHHHQQQQQQQQQSMKRQTNNNNHFDGDLPVNLSSTTTATTSSSITRKFPQARYTPATNWNDSPFDPKASTSTSSSSSSSSFATNGNFKKMPPPRPPPPKVQVNGRKTMQAPAPPNGHSGGLLTNIFHRNKKTATSVPSATASKAAHKAAAQNRIYGVSSGAAATTNGATPGGGNNGTGNNAYMNGTSNASINQNWATSWNSSTSISTSVYSSTTNFAASSNSNSTSTTVQEGQLISFDSPPSSPTFTQKSNSDCVSVDSFSSDSNFSSPNNGSVSQPESGFEDDFHGARSRPPTTSPLDPWETMDAYGMHAYTGSAAEATYGTTSIGTVPVRNLGYSIKQVSATADNPLCNGNSLLPPVQSLTMPTIIKPKIAQKPKAPKPPSMQSMGKPNCMLDNDAITPPSPPMPKSAPPPPPSTAAAAAPSGGISMLDIISGKVDAMALSAGSSGYVEEVVTPYCIAMYDFDGVEEDDLSFKENEKIYLLEQVSETWYRGRTRAGCVGIFPENYVQIKVPLGGTGAGASAASAAAAATTHKAITAAAAAAAVTPTLSAYCLYDFPGEVAGDLALKENDVVTILYRVNEDWLYGEFENRQGHFPANYLDHLPTHIPTL